MLLNCSMTLEMHGLLNLALKLRYDYICARSLQETIAASSHSTVVSTQAYVKPAEYLVDQGKETGLARIFHYF